MQPAGRIMDKEEAEMAAALTVLRTLSFYHVASDAPIEVFMDTESGDKKVVATKAVEKGSWMLLDIIWRWSPSEMESSSVTVEQSS